MRRDAEVYDLGEVDRALRRGRERDAPAAQRSRLRASFLENERVALFASDLSRSLSVFLPGASQIVHGRYQSGLFYLSTLGFLAALTAAILETLDRLIPTLQLLGYSVTLALWTVVLAFLMAAALHLGAIWSAQEPNAAAERPARHPVVPAVASLILPGWGQTLNGDRLRAMLFFGSCWLVAGIWIASSPPVTQLVDTYTPVVMPWEQVARAPLVLWTLKWTAPVVLWSLSVYDAFASASGRRRPR